MVAKGKHTSLALEKCTGNLQCPWDVCLCVCSAIVENPLTGDQDTSNIGIPLDFCFVLMFQCFCFILIWHLFGFWGLCKPSYFSYRQSTQGEGLWLWLLALVAGDSWQLTADTQHMTGDSLQSTHDTWNIKFNLFFLSVLAGRPSKCLQHHQQRWTGVNLLL